MHILGVKVDNISMGEAIDKVGSFLADNKQHYVVTPNPEIVLKAQKDEELKNILNKADLAIPDGFGLILASKLLGQPLKERVSGTDLMGKICLDERFKNYKIFLLGGFNRVAKKTIENLSKLQSFRYNSCGSNRAYNREGQDLNYKSGRCYNSMTKDKRFSWEENIEEAIKSINKFQPDIIFVSLGAPKQEKWIADNLAKIPSVKLAMTVGGAFDFLSGRIRRAPLFIQKMGLEWMWRLILQPWRLRRIYNAVVVFPLFILREKIRILFS